MTKIDEFNLVREHGPAAHKLSDDVLAGARAELMNELSAAPALDQAPARRGPRMKFRVVAAAAAALVVGLVVGVSQLGGTGTEQAGPGSPSPIRLVEATEPTLPPELRPIPDGLQLIGYSAEPGWIGRGYGPVSPESDDRVNVQTSWNGHNPQNMGVDFEETSYNGQPAYVAQIESTEGEGAGDTYRTAYLSWESAPGVWTVVTGDGRFASEDAVRTLADSLVASRDHVKLTIGVAPEGWVPVSFKDGVTSYEDPDFSDREITVSLRDGLDENFAEGSEVPVADSGEATVNGKPADVLELENGAWMLQAQLPDDRAFLVQASDDFSRDQVVELAEGVYAP
ncbi:hypothetical protein [Prauserella cavernicola]|uniref:Uncharacterized protein n=1 Tax=Prauserella cavernicola TaxID=2800127 RepID=A0A934V785_9PSEU|nr:hypothetical protein [Prauserella cavernicola]MBK1787434.1 hypothetical protein [Prauserella cavernicola]